MDEMQRWTDSAQAWNRWADGMASPADRINQPMLDFADARYGQVVLDLGAGVGEPSLTQAWRLAGKGLVVACDLVPGMLSGLRRRAAGHPYPPLPVAADMTCLPFADACADRILCRFGLMFVGDLALALAEMRRVLRHGGAAVLAVWGPRPANTLFDRLGRLLATRHGDAVDALLAPLFRFADPMILAGAAQEAGFTSIHHQVLELQASAKPDQPFWRPTLEMAFAPLLNSLDAAECDALYENITADFADCGGERRVPVAMSVHLMRLET